MVIGLGSFLAIYYLGRIAKRPLLRCALSFTVLLALHFGQLRHVTLPLIGSWWNLSPAFLILWIPGWLPRHLLLLSQGLLPVVLSQSPPACAVRDAAKSYAAKPAFLSCCRIFTATFSIFRW